MLKGINKKCYKLLIKYINCIYQWLHIKLHVNIIKIIRYRQEVLEMSSIINMNYGQLHGYNNSSYMNQNIRQDSDGIVIKKNNSEVAVPSENINSDKPETSSNEKINVSDSGRDSDNRLLSPDKIIDLAVNKDKSLIGSESNLETLDVKKAISDMQRDKILMEYQTFVSNPGQEDGFVKKIR